MFLHSKAPFTFLKGEKECVRKSSLLFPFFLLDGYFVMAFDCKSIRWVESSFTVLCHKSIVMQMWHKSV